MFLQLLHDHQALLFDMSNPKLILSKDDALDSLLLGENDEDVLNEVHGLCYPSGS